MLRKQSHLCHLYILHTTPPHLESDIIKLLLQVVGLSLKSLHPHRSVFLCLW